MPKDRPAQILQYFGYSDVPNSQKDVAASFYSMADELDHVLPECAEKSAGLRKLLEARDCFLRVASTKD